MTTIIHTPFVFGSTHFYSHYLKADGIILDQYEHYQKRTGRNRYSILTTHGVQTLSIPLIKGKNERQAMKDVKIAYHDRWVENHLHTIKSAYGKSPFFENFFDDIDMILNKRFNFLLDLNLATLTFAMKKLKYIGNVEVSDQYIQPEVDTNEDYLDLRKTQNVLEKPSTPYTQVWAEKYEFAPNLSILDLLFCTGPQAAIILR